MTTVEQAKRVDLTIVVPVYFNEGSLTTTMEAIVSRVLQQRSDFVAEVIFVDDGSRDGSFAELLQIHQRYPSLVKIIQFTRNFGQASALKAGFERARGDQVIFLSADGQDPVEYINQMLEARLQENFDIVICAREGRDESRYRILTSRIFYRLMRSLCFPNMPPGGFDYALLSRRVVRTILESWDAQPFIQGQILWTGFNMKIIPYRRQQRLIGRSRWTFGRKLTYMLDGVMNYSFFPIRMISLTGLLVALAGFIYAFVVLVVRLLVGHPVKGWAPLMIVVLVLGGFQMLTLGIFGEYLWRIFAQVKSRSPYVIEREIGFDDSKSVEP